MRGELQEVLPLPLPPLREGMLSHAMFERDGIDLYTAQVGSELRGVASVPALRRARAGALERHACAGALERHAACGWVSVC